MRGFVVLVCFAFAHAERVGYNSYASSGSHHGFGNRFKHRGTPPTPAPTPAPGIAAGVNVGLGGFAADAVVTDQYQPVESQSEFNKEFFSYAAPEDDFNDIEVAERLAATMRKNLRVVFIRAPENNAITNAALELAKQSADSKTSIYVLSKQTDYSDLANKLQTVQQGITEKPEVHFVKYRTPEDAVRAQQIIQNEYNNLGGSSRVANEALAPVLDFASPPSPLAPQTNAAASGGASLGSTNGGIGFATNPYLSSKLRL